MQITLAEREARAYITNDQVTLAALRHSEEELLEDVPTPEELKAERDEAEAWEGLAEKLGALVCTLAEHMVDANKAERRAAQERLANLSRTFGGFIDPRRYCGCAGTRYSLNELAAEVDRMADDVHAALLMGAAS